MARIAVSRAEFTKGWTRALDAYRKAMPPANNAHRLLLFYAVENGLKAIIMQIEMLTDEEASFSDELHDVNKLLARAKAASTFQVQSAIRVRNKTSSGEPRTCGPGALNQLWRYGCFAEHPTDAELEERLNVIATWIEENLP